MRLTRIDVHLVRLTLRAPFTTSFGTYRELDRPFVVIYTDDGLTGIGESPTLSDPAYKSECDPPSVLTSLREFILPAVARRQQEIGSIGTIEDLRASYSWIKGANFAKSAVEAALWDIEAQRSGQSLATFWGGKRMSFPVGVSIGGTTIEDVLGRADKAVELGYSRLKVKIWPGFDVQVATALREAHPDTLLQVD
ncbi:MAG: hypothetical protein AB7V46_07720, partial [Thermomicrobiales bacterium]